MKFTAGAWLLMSGLLGACAGSEHAPALEDVTDETQLDGRRPISAGGAGGSGDTGSAGATGSFIPTPTETAPPETEPPPQTELSPGTGGQGGSANTPGPCSRGTWSGNFSARSQADLSGLEGFTGVSGNLYVGTSSSSSATDVSTLAALHCLQTVDGLFTILENSLLPDLQGLQALELVDRLTLSTNAGLETLDGLGALSVVGTLHIRANATLSALTDDIVSAGEVIISANPQLPQCRADEFAAALQLACSYCDGNLDSCP